MRITFKISDVAVKVLSHSEWAILPSSFSPIDDVSRLVACTHVHARGRRSPRMSQTEANVDDPTASDWFIVYASVGIFFKSI